MRQIWSEPTVWAPEELVAHELTQSFIIDPLCPVGGISILHGKRWSGKSQIALTFAAALINGRTLLDRYTTYPMPVVYVSADMPFVTIQDRIKRILPDLAPSGLFRAIFCPSSLDITSGKTPGALADLADKPAFVIVDSLRKSHKMNENDSNTPSLVYGAWKDILHPESHVLFLHHDRKSVVNGSDLDPDEAFRGAGAWLDDAYCGMHLVKSGKKSRLLTFTKVQGAEEQEPIALVMNQETLLMVSKEKSAKELLMHLLLEDPDRKAEDLISIFVERTGLTRRRGNQLLSEVQAGNG